MDASNTPFWRFSLRVWRLPGLQVACLALQEHCGADANLLLFCGWIGQQGRALDVESLPSLDVHDGRHVSPVDQRADKRLETRRQGAGGTEVDDALEISEQTEM